jgi:hypothetical protein
VGSSDEVTDEIKSQPAKKKKGVDGSAVGKSKKAQPKRKRWGIRFLYYWVFTNEEGQHGFFERRI